MWGNGAGGFTQGPEYSVEGAIYPDMGHTLVSADLNGDPQDDIVTFRTGNVVRLLGQASDDPVLATGVISYWDRMGILFTADTTGDGVEDIVSYNTVPGNNAIFDYFVTIPGNDDGTFGDVIGSGSVLETAADPELSALGFGGAANMTFGDFNGDGDGDIISLNYSHAIDRVNLGFWAGVGDGSFIHPMSFLTVPEDIHIGESDVKAPFRVLAHGDVDLDGDLDVIIASTTDFIMLFINDGTGSFTAGDRLSVGDEPLRVELADLNLDGNIDIICTNQQSNTLTISWGQTDGSFGERGDGEALFTERQLDNQTQFGDMVIIDIDNSGYPDILYAESDTNKEGFADGSVQIILNPGM